jgi:hypothetical protein
MTLLVALAAGAALALQVPATVAPDAPLVLRAGTEVPLRTIEELSSKHARQGQRFGLQVDEEVRVGGYLVIPRGARATGEVTRIFEKGIFGRAGKIELQLLFVEVDGQRIRLNGQMREKGEPGTGALIAAAFVIFTMASFISGTSAVLPAGTSLVGSVHHDVRFAPKAQSAR